MKQRLEKLRQRLAEAGLDALLVSTPENRRYLSGFTGSAGYLLISGDGASLATDFRYVEQAGQQAPDFKVVRIGQSYDWFPKLVAELGARRVGFESQHLSVATCKAFTDALKAASAEGVGLEATTNLVEPIRAVKDAEELALLSKAVALADDAFETIAPTIKVGETEASVAWRLERHMREHGAESVAFTIIVGAGPNAALPHHQPSDRPIGKGETVVIDMGAVYRGYHSDMTRTLCLGPVSDTLRVVYDTVLGAQLTAIATVEAGMKGEEADGIARAIIAKAGYGDNFGHGLGHGIGLAVHEYPRVGQNSDVVLENGMVFSIEPGIYIPGWGGVRIEDTVVLEGGRVRPLTRSHKREHPT